jgi:hypothetical protein
MALSQSPPPLFKQGLPARLRMLIAVIAAIAMLYSDLHFGILKPLRQGLTMVLYPIEQVCPLWLGGLRPGGSARDARAKGNREL